MNAAQRFSFVVEEAEVGQRLDQVLAARVPDLSRRRARVLIDLGGVFIDGTRIKTAGRTMKAREKVVAHLGGALANATNRTGAPARAQDEARLPRFSIVHEDDDIVVVDKPAGLLTAPTPESDRSNLQGLLERRDPGNSRTRPRVFVVHRIDLQTSGLLVFAKTEFANEALSARFRTHDLDREYLTIVEGAFPDRIERVTVRVGGRKACTLFRVEERFGAEATLLRCRLETGRTHQIRIHARSVEHPVLGDARYGVPGILPPPRMALHATRLGFVHPATGQPVTFESPWPRDLERWLGTLRARHAPASTTGAPGR